MESDKIEIHDWMDGKNKVGEVRTEDKNKKEKKSVFKRLRKSFKRFSCASGNNEDIKDQYNKDAYPLDKPRQQTQNGNSTEIPVVDVQVHDQRSVLPLQTNNGILSHEKNVQQSNGHQEISNGQRCTTPLLNRNQHDMCTTPLLNRTQHDMNQASTSPKQPTKFINHDETLVQKSSSNIQFGQPISDTQNRPVSTEHVNTERKQETHQSAQSYTYNKSSNTQEQNARYFKSDPKTQFYPHQPLSHQYKEKVQATKTMQFYMPPCVPREQERRIHYGRISPDLYDEYDFSHSKRGIAVLIIMTKFKDQPARPFAVNDCTRMTELFSKLGFKVEIIQDETSQNVIRRLKEIRNTIADSDMDCFACAISSHGEEIPSKLKHEMPNVKLREHAIFTYDGVISTKIILELFKDGVRLDNGRLFKGLRGKPKLFFIQACRSIFQKPTEECLDSGVNIEVVYGYGHQRSNISVMDKPVNSEMDTSDKSPTHSEEYADKLVTSEMDTSDKSPTHSDDYAHKPGMDTANKSDEYHDGSNSSEHAKSSSANSNSHGLFNDGVDNDLAVNADYKDHPPSPKVYTDDSVQSTQSNPQEQFTKNNASVTSSEICPDISHPCGSTIDLKENNDTSNDNTESHMDTRYMYDHDTNRYHMIPDNQQLPMSTHTINYSSGHYGASARYPQTPSDVSSSNAHNHIPVKSCTPKSDHWTNTQPKSKSREDEYSGFSANLSNEITYLSRPAVDTKKQSDQQHLQRFPDPDSYNTSITYPSKSKMNQNDLDNWEKEMQKMLDVTANTNATVTTTTNATPRSVQQFQNYTTHPKQMNTNMTYTPDPTLYKAQRQIIEAEKVEVCDIPCDNDFLVMYTSPSGFIGWSTGDKNNPTIYDIAGWLPYCLHSVLDNWTHKTLLEALTEANAVMVKEMEANCKYKNVACIYHRLMKDVIFRPKT